MSEKKYRKASLVLSDLLAETVYDPTSKQTSFAVFQDGEVRYLESIPTEFGETFPIDGRSAIVSKGVILLPSEAIEFGTGTELLNEVQKFIHKRVDVSESYERIAALYVLLSWTHDRFNELPYLRVRGDYGTGKSRFLQVVGSICYRPIFTGGATTTSPIFRMIDHVGGTLVFDEADFNDSNEKSDIVKILNSGYQKGVPVLRVEGQGVYEVKSYDVYGPKILATRFTYNDQALESRFLTEDMGRGSLRDDIPLSLNDQFREEARGLRNKLLMWRFRNYHKPIELEERPMKGLHPRLNQIASPLLSLIEDVETRQMLMEHIERYNKELISNRGGSWEASIVLGVYRLHHESQLDGLGVSDIAHKTNENMELLDDPLTAKKVGWYLRSRLQLKPQRTNKGYVLSFSQNKERLDFWRERYGITEEEITGEEKSTEQPRPAEVEVDMSVVPF